MDLKYRNWKVKDRVIIWLVALIGIIFAFQIACKKVLPVEIPSLVTLNVTDITSASLTSGGLVFSSGGDPVMSRGICMSINKHPTISDTKTVDGTGKGSFTSTISGLKAGTTYYIRAYATNNAGTGYGNEVTCLTGCNLPAAPGSISGSTNVAENAACAAYSISAVTDATGYTWTVPAGAAITSGQGTTGIIVDFGTTGGNVSVRSENSCGNSIYTNLNISMTSISNCGIVTDIEGNVYNTVTIGTQCWLAENLKTTRYNDASLIPKESDFSAWSNLITPGYCWYNNDSSTYMASYGALYNWYVIATGKLCPAGWHVPTDGEWTELTDYLCGNSMASGKLKESGTIHWNDPNSESTNSSRFTALPGGYRSYTDGAFFSLGNNGSWWSATADSGNYAWIRAMTNYGPTEVRVLSIKRGYGISVRCLKDH